jgi:predicted dehydrogenase
VFGAFAPSNRINVGAIGTGRISRGHDLPGIWQHDVARIMAVCDLDGKRAQDAVTLVNGHYAGTSGKPYSGVTAYTNYRELLANKDVDAVVISTPDHWHALIAMDAVAAGKDVYLQKPASLTIAEGRALSNAVRKSGRIFQIGSQQRSTVQFRYAAELVLNGRIGRLKAVEIGLPGDPSGPDEPVMPVPANLDYDMWLGSTPLVPYTENRVHPQTGYGRPGWLRCEQFGAGMITGWGAHHIDIAQWCLGMDGSGPAEIIPPKKGESWGLTYKYASGISVIASPCNGILFSGTEGKVEVNRGYIRTWPESLVDQTMGANEVHLYESGNHQVDWLNCIRTRSKPIADVEIGQKDMTQSISNDSANLCTSNGTDADGNTISLEHLAVRTSGTIVRSAGGHRIFTLGVSDLIVVHTPDATLVANKHDEESIRQLVKLIAERGWQEYL